MPPEGGSRAACSPTSGGARGRSPGSPCRLASSRRCSCCRTGATTSSTTGRCRSRGSRPTTWRRSWQRVTWFPILHDTFSRMWPVLALGLTGAWGILARWRRASDAERLLFLWVAVGTLELLVHDVGNERRFVFLIPALVALASLVLARGSLLPDEAALVPRRTVVLLAPAILYTAYVISGPIARLPFLAEVQAHVLRHAVRLAAAAGVVLGFAFVAAWPRLAATWSRRLWSPAVATALVAVFAAWNVAQFSDWAAAPDLRKLRGVTGPRPRAAARHAGPGQAGQRPGARERDPADLHRPRVRQLRRPETAMGCAVYFDLYGSGNRLRRGPDRGRAGRVSGLADHHDLRRRGNAFRPRQSSPDRKACAPLTSAPSRRTPTCGSAPNTTTRSSSTTGAPRSSRSSSAPAWPCAAACSTPGAAAAACRCRSPRRPARSSASIRSTGSARRRAARRRSAGSANLHFALADGMALPFSRAPFDLVLSHAVIEHVADAPLYLRECARVLAPGGRDVPVDRAVPVVRRRAPAAPEGAGAAAPAVRPPRSRSRRSVPGAPRARGRCREPANENSFIKLARQGEIKHDDLLELVRVSRLRAQIAAAGLRDRPRGAARHRRPSAGCRSLSARLLRTGRPGPQDMFISNMEYVLARAGSGE